MLALQQRLPYRRGVIQFYYGVDILSNPLALIVLWIPRISFPFQLPFRRKAE